MTLPASPCIRVCCLDDQDVCLGCFRLLTEITGWQAASEEERERILACCVERREAHDAALKARLQH